MMERWMEVRFEKKDDSLGFVVVTVAPKGVEKAYKAVLSNLGQRGYNVAGFRPGRVPRPMFEARYGQEFLAGQVKSWLIESTGGQAAEQSIQQKSEPTLTAESTFHWDEEVLKSASELSEGEPFVYRVGVSLKGDAEGDFVADFTKQKAVEACQNISVKMDLPAEIKEEDVDRSIHEILLSNADWRSLTPKEKAQPGDEVNVEFLAMHDFDTEEEAQKHAKAMALVFEGVDQAKDWKSPKDSENPNGYVYQSSKGFMFPSTELPELLSILKETPDYVSSIEAHKQGTVEDVEACQHKFMLGNGSMSSQLEQQVQGLQIGEVCANAIGLSEDHPIAHMAKRWVAILARLFEARRSVVPALSNELAEEVAGAKTVEEWKQWVRTDLEKKRAKGYNASIIAAVMGEAYKKFSEAKGLQNPPDQFLEEAWKGRWNAFAKKLAMLEINMEEYMQLVGMTEEDLRKKMLPAAFEDAWRQWFLVILSKAVNAEDEGNFAKVEEWLLKISDHPDFLPVG